MDAPAALGRAGLARDLLLAFADRTGLSSADPPERYLWTDAFAVCTLVGLGEESLALRLVEQVHHVLGRHRPDDPREGWLSGLPDEEAERHPASGGLRIGKPLPERAPDEPIDERREWERDGQYFHYVTQWMHALNQVALHTGEARFNVWARELAETAHDAFTTESTWGGRRMHWKMSVDLGRPLVAAMGAHDPLDGLLTCLDLSAAASRHGWSQGPDVSPAAADFASLMPARLATPDPLGIGGLLRDAWRADRLRRAGALRDDVLPARLVEDAAAGLAAFVDSGELGLPVSARLAFRELGLAIGLAAVPRLGASRPDDPGLGALAGYEPLRVQILTSWLPAESRATRAWHEHRNINDVMLASAISPDGYLGSSPSG